jgi:hypothetical protein
MIDSISHKIGPVAVQPLDPELESRPPEYWRSRAEEARAIAEKMADSFSRQMLESVAASYDKIAEWAEKQPSHR